jgi:hypothetical protein
LNKMIKTGITIMLALCLSSFSYSQDYNTGIGLRGGFGNGVTIKHFIGSKAALEGIIASRWRGLELTGLYEIHNRAFDTDRLNWYYGFGAHIGFWDSNNRGWGEHDRSYTVIGVDGILGLEYNFAEIPFNLSVDWKPAFNFYGYSGFWADGGAVSIRYIF